MTTLEIILIAILWIIGGIFIYHKHKKFVFDRESLVMLAIATMLLFPLWIVGAIIRQVFIEDWK